MELDTINLEDVHRMLGERDTALYKAARRIEAQQQEIARLRADLETATKVKTTQE